MATDIEIKAGPELDQAVANAVGLKSTIFSYPADVPVLLMTSREWDELRGIEHPTCEGDVATVPFQPSTDLNAAFAAAEAVRMFSPRKAKAMLYLTYYGKWIVNDTEYVDNPMGQGDTPALAICAAILKLKEQA